MIADIHARYYGTELDDRSLTPGDHPRFGATALRRLAQPRRGAVTASGKFAVRHPSSEIAEDWWARGDLAPF